MVDNFNKIRDMLVFEEPGDCYYLQLLYRQSDDPMKNGVQDPNYHGNMCNRSLKDYFVRSLDEFDQLKNEIVTICNACNVRAYIRLNKRNFKKITLNILRHVTEQVCADAKKFSSPNRLVSSAAGKANCAGTGKTWIVDIDSEYLNYKDQILEFVCGCNPYDSELKAAADRLGAPNEKADLYKVLLNTEMGKIPQIQTKSGVHLITRKFDTQRFTEDWNMFAAEKQIIQPLPRSVIDGDDWVHFSLYGVYLSKTQDFLKICKKHAKSVSTDKPCKNKTIVHTTIDGWKAFHDDWTEYCKDTGFWLKCPDIHKDNPTVLFVP